MTVEVEYETIARAELVELLTPQSDSVEDALRFAGLYLDDIAEQLIARLGDMPGAIQIDRPDGTRCWWRYVRGVWVGYTVADRRTWVFGATTRLIQVFGFRDAPPRRVAPRSPAPPE